MSLNYNNQKYKKKDGKTQQFTLRNANNKLHICHCGCNVFAQLVNPPCGIDLYECNRCHTYWEAQG